MSRWIMALVWLFSLAYTGYVVVMAFLMPALLGDTAGVVAALAVTLGPVVAVSIWAAGR